MGHANKAWIAALVAGLSSLTVAAQGSQEAGPLDWIIIALSAIVAGLTVYIAPNRPSS